MKEKSYSKTPKNSKKPSKKMEKKSKKEKKRMNITITKKPKKSVI
jgi:hypothetical protein